MTASDTPAARVQSHATPKHRYLKQHVAEVRAAAEAIRDAQGGVAWRAMGDALIDALTWLHDLGKATAAFQAYIAAPDRWRGDPKEKGHTLPSLVLTAVWCASKGLDPIATVSLALGVRGHHGAQPHNEDTLYKPLLDDENAEVLVAQLPTLDRHALAAEGVTEVPAVDDPEALLARAFATLREALDAWRERPLAARITARVIARAAYSVLLEADKVFLAVETAVVLRYLHRARLPLPASLVDARCATLTATPMDALRARAREAALVGYEATRGDGILTLTLPTGAGKTLLAARWALAERERAVAEGRPVPTVIVALPMLSIVEQTERVWREVLGVGRDDGDALMPFHSLSERVYDREFERATEDFYLDTWRSEVVVTTFDQLLLALYSDRARHALRYHRLLHARIVLDEAQYVPPVLWAAVSAGLRELTRQGDTRVLAMSATPSPLLDGAVEVLRDPDSLYAGLRRYELRLKHETVTDFEAFVSELIATCRPRLAAGEGTLVTLNVRATARATWERLRTAGLDPAMLSGDMTPAHRLAVIAAVREGGARVVVSTQCVEAGVDLDFHHVVRDLAPLDAIVQIAGRCNRHGLRETAGTVTVLHLRGASGRDDAADVYDRVALQCTEEALAGRAVIAEAEVLTRCRDWYQLLAARKYKGHDLVEKWASIEATPDVQKLLRGEDTRETLVVTERDPGIAAALAAAMAVSDRWERRAALRALAPRIARESVAVSERVKKRLTTRPLDAMKVHWELGVGQYDAVCGVDSRG